jgi:hypothetical protein
VDRQLIAYLIIAAMVATLGALVAFKRYYSRGRIYQRRLRQEESDYQRRMAEGRP